VARVILVVNAGSSSHKLRLLDDEDRIIAAADTGPEPDEAAAALTDLAGTGVVAAVGHRVVHGGPRRDPAIVDDALVGELHALTPLAPLHQPPALAALDAARRVLPRVPHVACFDTAFHATLPAAAATFAIPDAWRDLGVHRVGFHGLSHAYATRTAGAMAGAGRRVVSCHLGAGASLAAVRDGHCVDTTMGFTPLDGLVMATRAGSIDPGALLWLQHEHGLTAAELRDALERHSGLLALAGTGHLGEIMARALDGDAAAVLARDVYLHRLRAGVAAMAAALDGLDVLVFTGGVGEHVSSVRAGAVEGLGFLGCRLDADANAQADHDAVISPEGCAVAVVVVTAREDIEIARGARSVLHMEPTTA
jgi:acetate kinase